MTRHLGETREFHVVIDPSGITRKRHLAAVFHSAPAQLFEEALGMHRKVAFLAEAGR